MRRGIFAGLLGFAASQLSGQNALYVKTGDNAWARVLDVWGNVPVIMKDGKLTPLKNNEFGMQKVDEYNPAFVSIRRMSGTNWDTNINHGTSNERFVFNAEFVSAYPLNRVFIVLDMETADLGPGYFIRQVGNLVPYRPCSISVAPPISYHLGNGRFFIHVFSDGREVLHSLMPPVYREQVLDQMVGKRIQGLLDAPPKRFIDPLPAYPQSLVKSHPNGTATIQMQIKPNGEVLNPMLKGASDPAFGESALTAIRIWRFLPKIQGGIPVKTEAEIPLNFAYHPPQPGN